MPRLSLLLLSALPAFAQDPYPFGHALDGEPGLGDHPEARALAELFRSPRGGTEELFLSELCGLSREVRVLTELARARYERLGYFDVFEDSPRARVRSRARELHRFFERAQKRPFATAWSPEAARALALMLLDERFHLRGPLLHGAEAEERDLRAGVALLVGHAFGSARLEDPELVAEVAARTDLAAARMRALRADLETLYEPLAAPSSSPPEDLVLALRRGDSSKGPVLLRNLAYGSALSAAARRAGTRSSDFDRSQSAFLARRKKDRSQARVRVREVLRLLPFVAGEEPLDGTDLKAVERYRKAAELAGEAVLLDPFLEGAHYLRGIATDFFAGRSVSIPHFDRYLALRGIRHWEHRTFAYRWLSGGELYALLVVADWRPAGGGR